MKSVLLQLLFLALLLHGSFQYNTYPRRYVRDHSAHLEACPLHCRCMDLNQRSARGLFDAWNVDQSWQNTEPDDTGRSVVCQGLRELPARIPSGEKLRLVTFNTCEHYWFVVISQTFAFSMYRLF